MASTDTATPGPWKVNKYGGIGSGETGTAQVIISSDGWAHDWTPAERERQAADARLIAAAPDMCEVLQQLMTDCQTGNADISDTLGHDLRRALAKANGEGKP